MVVLTYCAYMHLSFGLVASRPLVAESNHVGYFESKSGSVLWLAYVPYSLGVAHVRREIGFCLGVISHRAAARETLAGVDPDPHGFAWST
jgi:hypothetical protein